MTVQALKEAVIHLGFSDTLDDNDALFRESAERALSELSLLRPRRASFTLYHLPPRPVFCRQGPIPADTLSLTAPSGGSFYLRILGHGCITIEGRGTPMQIPFEAAPGGSVVFKGRLPAGEGEIVFSFSGKCSFLICLAIYRERMEEPPDPMGFSSYDLSALIGNFAALLAPPSCGGRVLTEESSVGSAVSSPRDALGGESPAADSGDYYLINGRLLNVKNSSPGILTLTYRRRLSLPTAGELPISEEEARLLPLLCAAYVWLDDEPEKATFYFNRFREGIGQLPYGFSSSAVYPDISGWG